MKFFKLKNIVFLSMTVWMFISTALADNRKSYTYRFGVVPQFDQAHIRDVWRPVLEELEKLTGFGFVLKGSADIPEFEKQYLRGDFDFAYMNPYFVNKAAEQGYIPLVRDVDMDLQGIVVVRKDSRVRDIEELSGLEVGFPSPNALGASMLLRADFRNKFKLSVLPIYLQTHSAVYREVLAGKVAAGGGVQKSLAQQPYEIRDGLKIIYRTRFFPSHPIMAHHRVPILHREKVMQAFLDMESTSKGKGILARIPIHHLGITSLVDYKPIATWGLEKFYDRY